LFGNTKVGGLAVAAYASAGWALVSWWPHSNMHRVNTSFQGLIVIDWTFHLTLIAGAAIIGVFLYRTLGREQSVARRESGETSRLLDAQA
jgi:cell division protein FtsX